MSASESDDGFFMRRVIFSVIVAVVGVTGAWMLLSTLAGGGGAEMVLSATDRVAGGELTYTVVLREIPPSQEEAMRELVSKEPIRELAAGSEFEFLELRNGNVAVCVGSFEEPDSPELERLLRRFREFAPRDQLRPFKVASVRSYRE